MSETRKHLEIVQSYLGWGLAKLVLDYSFPVKHQILSSEKMIPRRCYNNALSFVIRDPRRYSYMEGYAAAVIPVEHAWVYDRYRKAILDPTWKDEPPPSEYIGIRFQTPYLRAYALKHNTACLLGDPKHAKALATDAKLRARAIILP